MKRVTLQAWAQMIGNRAIACLIFSAVFFVWYIASESDAAWVCFWVATSGYWAFKK